MDDLPSLVADAVRDRKNLRKILSLLYDADMEQRFKAAKALGAVAGIKPEFIRQVWGRILRATDDTMSCWGVAEALGEIARVLPDLRGKILMRLNRFRKDESTCQGYVWALCRIGQVEHDKVVDFVPELMHFLDIGAACMVGQSIWALGELGIQEAAGKIETFLDDERETWIYENDGVYMKTIGTAAAEALKKFSEQ